MLLNKRNLAVVEASSDEESRYTLRGILMEADGATVATDGHILARVSPCGVKPDNFPNNGHGDLAGYSGKVLLPAEFCKDARKALPKKTHIPILENVAIGAVTDDGVIKKLVAQADLPPKTIEAEPLRGQFPNYQAVIPREEERPAAEFTFNADLMARLLKVAKLFGDGSIRLRVYSADKAARLDAVDTHSGQEFCGVLMPLRPCVTPKYK